MTYKHTKALRSKWAANWQGWLGGLKHFRREFKMVGDASVSSRCESSSSPRFSKHKGKHLWCSSQCSQKKGTTKTMSKIRVTAAKPRILRHHEKYYKQKRQMRKGNYLIFLWSKPGYSIFSQRSNKTKTPNRKKKKHYIKIYQNPEAICITIIRWVGHVRLTPANPWRNEAFGLQILNDHLSRFPQQSCFSGTLGETATLMCKTLPVLECFCSNWTS